MKERLNLSVIVNPNAGFCHGVKHAVHLAEELLASGKEVYCVGMIVHNGEEVSRLEKLGLKTISYEDLSKLHGKTILFRAHGESPSTYVLAESNGNTVVDASCRVVLKLQDRIRKSHENGQSVYIFGKKDHPETIALIAQTGGTAIAFDDISQLDLDHLPPEITLYSQTTKSLARFYETADLIQKGGIKVNLNDTVCRQVHNREAKLALFCKEFDINIFIAGKDSSNGKVLFNICKEANDNTFFISGESELKKEWFMQNDTVGISGATSTPFWQMEAVKKVLEDW